MKISLQAFVCIFTCTVTNTIGEARSQTETCTLGDHRYQIGETWHPKLLSFGENTCVNCTCTTGGDVICSGVDCSKPECDEPRILRGHCCPTCDVRMEDKRSDATEQPGCEFHGSHYDDGDIFPSNKTALKPKYNNQCVLCACYRGGVICHLKTCLPSHKCRKTMKVDDDCCLQCEEAPNLVNFTRLLIDNMNTTLEEGDCLSATGRHKNGTTWKPVIGQYGEMKCIVCTCINGQINCGRVQCSEESDLNCNTTKIDSVGCCKQCTGDKMQTKERLKCRYSLSDSNIKNQCSGKMKPSRNKRNRNKNVNKKTRSIFTSDMHLDDVLHRLCIPDKTPYLVYHLKQSNFESLAFDSRNKQIEYIYLTFKKGRIQNAERKLVQEEYRRNITVANILGTVKTKDVQKLMKRLERIQQRCKRKCKRKVLDNAIKRLRAQELDLTKSCDVSTPPT